MGMGLGTLGSRFGRLGNAPSKGVGVPAWASGTDLWTDFTVPRGTLSDPTDTHASTIYAPNAAGVYLPFAANVLTRTDLGLQTVPTRIELVRGVDVMDSAGWTNTNTTVAATTSGDSPANDDNARLITQGGTVGDGRNFSVVPALAGATNYVSSQWFKSTGSARYIRFVVSDNVASVFEVGVDLQTKTVNAGGTGGTGTIVSTGVETGPNGWFRVYAVGTVPTGSGSTSWGAATRVVTALGGTTVAAGNYLAYGLNVQQGSFAVPTVMNTGTGASATVNGNQQVIDLTGRLGTGVAGIVQVNVLALTPGATNFELIFSINDGTGNNSVQIFNGGTQWFFLVKSGGVDQANFAVRNSGTGVQTFVFAASTNFAACRAVGSADPGPDTVVTYPALNRFGVGGTGFSVTGQNAYQQMAKLALSFGAQDATTFAAMYARGLLA
jgi:hypothetical protein